VLLRKLVIILVGKILIILQSSFVYAHNSQPFDSLEIGLQYTANINSNAFHDFYEPGKGVEGFAEMPFYYGNIQAGIQILSHDAKKKGVSSNEAKGKIQVFQGVFTNMKWGKQYLLHRKVGWFIGIGVGLYAFLPSSPKWSAPYEVAHFTETELGACLNSYLSYAIYSNWTVRFGGSYNRIFTYKQIDLVYFSIGVGYSFASPRWMKVFLE
jgi:hypothetical protein